uniref:Uncharacterized protein n=1 Tax=Lyophyllum shimeji TaxID=47721 RepID=A0A2Z4HH59_LYOSH|nr:hypothetical protein [Lyophyllum shimeji]AWW14112.1 hypothetical protein [Lyophyllum shimeji]
MSNLILIKALLTLSVLLFSALFVYVSKFGVLGPRIKKFCGTNSIIDYFILVFIITSIFMLVIQIIIILNIYYNSSFKFPILNVEPNNNTNGGQDPVRFWPSGVAQTWGMIATMIGLYRLTPGSNRLKATAALGSLAVTVPSMIVHTAIENPNGFNRLMFSWSEYIKTGDWPATVPAVVQDEQLKSILENALKNASATTELSSTSSTPSSSTGTATPSNYFLPEDFNLDSFSLDYIYSFIATIFRPFPVEGFIDELLGQQLFIHLLLLVIVLGSIILLTIFIFINILLHNKNFILKRFNNKFILFYIKYQLILAKFSIIILPMFILLGLFNIALGLYFLITQAIPFEEIPIDLHTFVKK